MRTARIKLYKFHELSTQVRQQIVQAAKYSPSFMRWEESVIEEFLRNGTAEYTEKGDHVGL